MTPLGSHDSKNRAARKHFPTVAQVRELPLQHRYTIPADWRDRNGHVNVQYYLRLYDLGGYEILQDAELEEDYLNSQDFGLFDLEHHIRFRSEVLVGDIVSGYNRLLGLSEKRFHGMYFIINETQDRLACTVEYLSAGVDFKTRRSAPFPVRMKQGMDTLLAAHLALSWSAPVCGAMGVDA